MKRPQLDSRRMAGSAHLSLLTALFAVAAGLALAACGSSAPSDGIPPDQAQGLTSKLMNLKDDYDSGECTGATRKLDSIDTQIQTLAGEGLNPEIHSGLEQLSSRLREEIADQCVPSEPTTPTTTTTPEPAPAPVPEPEPTESTSSTSSDEEKTDSSTTDSSSEQQPPGNPDNGTVNPPPPAGDGGVEPGGGSGGGAVPPGQEKKRSDEGGPSAKPGKGPKAPKPAKGPKEKKKR